MEGMFMSMTIDEALGFIHNVSWVGSKPGLSRTAELLERLGNPQKKLKFVHIAGTNGKGSTAAMLSSILSAAGYRTGLYTSPYIICFNERIQVCGEYITDEDLAEVTEKVRPHALAMEDSPTEFELVCAIAFEYFAAKNCDIVVLEVGLGGRLDATNVISAPDCAVITNIGLDHTAELGGTLELIAAEKAGIIKSGCDVVIYQQEQAVMETVKNVCELNGAALYTADFSEIKSISDDRNGQVFSYKARQNLSIPLLGDHQLKNAAVALCAVNILSGKGWKIPDSAVAAGLLKTVWPARFQIVSKSPWFVVDGGHNPQCAATVADNLKRYFPKMRRILLIGLMADKDYQSMTDILNPVTDEYVTVTPDNPRAMPAKDLAEHLSKYGKPVTACASIEDGVNAALKLAGTDGVACSVGSLYMSGAILLALKQAQETAF